MEKEPPLTIERSKIPESRDEKIKLISRLREQIAEKKGVDPRIFHTLIRSINISDKDQDLNELSSHAKSGSGLMIDALYHPLESTLELKPHYFKNKTEAEQKHILAHEYAHSLEPLIAGNSKITRLIESFGEAYDSGYIQKVGQKHQGAERTTDIVGAFLNSKTVAEFQTNLIAISAHPDKENDSFHVPYQSNIVELFIELEENVIGKLKTQTPQDIYSMTKKYDFAFDYIEEGFDDNNPSWSMSAKNMNKNLATAKPNQSFSESVKAEAQKFASYGFWGFFK
ncbi:MAG: hypothetical protein UR93_C0004G0016 [Berkelbacteria bacterium GW2011_GWA2_35_9]|uniref:Uncharacterized protein n=1 Tax=Berkelbacteria bacterium GW2011_GWA2_35_9 TaxID=1618333 RepID=A0A0G0D6W2_9BACT|nr:MAG: hypothetical protein UR93_C0004G0016 [Berkelbacteria bacterium GW2011_GWA2_35_9]